MKKKMKSSFKLLFWNWLEKKEWVQYALLKNSISLNFLILVHNTNKRFNWERLDESVGTCVGTPPTQPRSGCKSLLELETGVVYGALQCKKILSFSENDYSQNIH